MKETPCYLGYYGYEIDSNGDFYTNCWAMKPVGNVKDNKIEDIVSSEKFLTQVDNMYNKKCNGCSCGYILNSSIDSLKEGEKLKVSIQAFNLNV